MSSRPGPDRLDGGLASGGIVVHVYAIPTDRLLFDNRFADVVEAARAGQADVERAANFLHPAESGVRVVTFDGDTGERFGYDIVLHRGLL